MEQLEQNNCEYDLGELCNGGGYLLDNSIFLVKTYNCHFYKAFFLTEKLAI